MQNNVNTLVFYDIFYNKPNQNTLIYERLCRTMKPIWINKVREKQDKSEGIIPPPEIPTMRPAD